MAKVTKNASNTKTIDNIVYVENGEVISVKCEGEGKKRRLIHLSLVFQVLSGKIMHRRHRMIILTLVWEEVKDGRRTTI